MKTHALIAVTLALSTSAAGLALADVDHGSGSKSQSEHSEGGMPGQHHEMMKMMMQMHSGMMGQSGSGPMAMMDHDMMRMMMSGQGMMRRHSFGGFQNMHQSALADYDADSDGTLSIDEFETFHSAMIRETMVDRFQHLDADGDGQVTKEEIEAQTRKPEMHMMTGVDGMGHMKPKTKIGEE